MVQGLGLYNAYLELYGLQLGLSGDYAGFRTLGL